MFHGESDPILLHGLCHKLCMQVQHRIMHFHGNGMWHIPEHGQIIAAVPKYIGVLDGQPKMSQDKLYGAGLEYPFGASS